MVISSKTQHKFLQDKEKLTHCSSRANEHEPKVHTLDSGIDVGYGINVGPGKFVKKNKHRALNKRRA